MTTTLEIVDNKVLPKWTGRKGGGSLFQTMSKGNADNANKLSAKEILAVYICVKACPFPLGRGDQIYKMTLEKIDAGGFVEPLAKAESINLGELRKSLVVACGDGCNAPHDMYLDIAVKVQEAQTPATV